MAEFMENCGIKCIYIIEVHDLSDIYVVRSWNITGLSVHFFEIDRDLTHYTGNECLCCLGCMDNGTLLFVEVVGQSFYL